MITVVAIVEGDGEVSSLPILLWRLHNWMSLPQQFVVKLPIRVERNQFLNDEHVFRDKLNYADARCVQPGWILILLDADDDCPKVFATSILSRAQQILPHRRISVVLANREYEAWFIAAARSLVGHAGFRLPSGPLVAAESVRGAKEWVNNHLPKARIYRVKPDQAVFSRLMDLQQAHDRSRSFRKLCSDWVTQMAFAGP